MNNRLNIQDLAGLLSERSGKERGEMERFLRDLVAVISEGVYADKIVKVKGLGTFKIIPVEKRESIHVNTGERFLIPAHYKFSFLPSRQLTRKLLYNIILGVRKFDGEGIPWKSRFGNALTEKIFAYVAGIHVSDTQTGLRGIPAAFLPELLEVPGERFEYEMQMLMECAGKYYITEIPIETIYDSEDNHQTHFDPIADSIRIYKILGKKFVKYIFASFSSCVIDIVLFAIFCSLLKTALPGVYLAVATAGARILSAIYNYAINYRIVFRSNESIGRSGIKYFVLAVIQMCCSAGGVILLKRLIPIFPDVLTTIHYIA